MWRCVIALAHADGGIDADERQYLNRIFKGMHRAYAVTPEQDRIFAEDIKTPQKFGDLLRYINDPEYRGLLVYYGHILAHTGGIPRPTEEDILKSSTPTKWPASISTNCAPRSARSTPRAPPNAPPS